MRRSTEKECVLECVDIVRGLRCELEVIGIGVEDREGLRIVAHGIGCVRWERNGKERIHSRTLWGFSKGVGKETSAARVNIESRKGWRRG